MNATSPSASRRSSRAESRAWIAVTASVLVTAMPASEAAVSQASRRWRCVVSRWTRSSSPTPSIPATSLRNPRRRPSPSSRRSAASGSARFPVGRPRRSNFCRNAGGKHSSASRPGNSLAKGSPLGDGGKHAAFRPGSLEFLDLGIGPVRLAASGEHSTTRNWDEASAPVSHRQGRPPPPAHAGRGTSASIAAAPPRWR